MNKFSGEAQCYISETGVPHAAHLRIWQESEEALRPPAVSVLGDVYPRHLRGPQGFLDAVNLQMPSQCRCLGSVQCFQVTYKARGKLLI